MIELMRSCLVLNVHAWPVFALVAATTILPLNTSHKELIRLRADELRIFAGIAWKECELKELNEQVMTGKKFSAIVCFVFLWSG